MILRPPRSTRTDTLFPYTTLFRSIVKQAMSLEFACPVIVVGGTNGKGSTCAMLESILLQAGYRVGLYTSPHLLHFRSEEHTSELQSLMRISYAVFCLKTKRL